MMGFPKKRSPKRVIERHPYVAGNELYLFQQPADTRYEIAVYKKTAGITERITRPALLVQRDGSGRVLPGRVTVSSLGSAPEDTNPLFDWVEITGGDVRWSVTASEDVDGFRFDFGTPSLFSDIEFVVRSNAATNDVRWRLYGSEISSTPTFLLWQIDTSISPVRMLITPPFPVSIIRYLWLYAQRISGTQRTAIAAEAYFYFSHPNGAARGVRLTESADEYIVEYTPLGA